MNSKLLFAALFSSTVAATASAQDFGDLSVGLGLTSFGYSLQGEYEIQPKLSLRAMIMGGLSFSDEFDDDDFTVDGKLDLGGFAVLADYYPLSNPWRISGGLFFSNTELTGTFDDEGTVYEGDVKFKNEVAPMITTGFNYPFGNGWAFSGDVGVVVSSLEVSSAETDPSVQDSIDEANDDLSDIPVFPYIGFAVSYSY
ncbi:MULTISPECIES: hypothetical protein [unclassified Yoonia]|uniref:hypothetical protein n=1 Tax=unclassified Yoonia TaxID=2629118 RepID=UPI002AFEF2EB|nr:MULTISPECIES: hypothetical protein [unclassified Yoonia]